MNLHMLIHPASQPQPPSRRQATGPGLRRAAVATALLLAAGLAGADTTQLANEPLITMSAVMPKPNLMVILDDSGSMDRDYMPDDMSSTSRYGYRSAQCSGVAYDPNITYTPPVYADGSSYPDASFTAAWKDGFVQDGATTNLMGEGSTYTASDRSGNGPVTFTFSSGSGVGSSTFQVGDTVTFRRGSSETSYSGTVTSWTSSTKGGLFPTTTYTLVVSVSGFSSTRSDDWRVTAEGTTGQTYYTYSGSQTALNWTYDSNGKLVTTTNFYKECMSSVGSTPGSKVFTAQTVTKTSAEATNYANWYSYYRTRRLLMRTAMGQAMNVLDDGYRVGFMQLNQQSLAKGTSQLKFRPVSDFSGDHKVDFYTSLYAATGSSTTPSRSALSTAGRYFAKQLSKQATDPMQYACQRNFALLTTDGYWNTTNKGLNLGGFAIGNADKDASRPMKDSYSDTLADVAYYYYETDLRTEKLGNCTGALGKDVCANILAPAGKDTATHQHMTTFTVGMGVSGTLKYDKNYLSQTSGDYYDLIQGNKNWPNPPETSSGGDARNVDDLWHAAVNGRGQYYSAQNASELAEAIQGVVSAVQETTGAAASASTSVLDLVQGEDNTAFEASYTTGVWTGDVVARRMDAHTAELEAGEPLWSAKAQLDARTTARKIYFNKNGTRTEFTWDNLDSTTKAHFTDRCTSDLLTQCTTLSAANKTLLNNGEKLVNFLRGVRTDEATAANTTSPLFRARASRMGDVVHSKPIHVGKPPFNYSDAGYTAFKEAQKNRKKVVYVGANDGMLHALDAATGEELWAFIPTAVMPNLYKLADTRYGSANKPHQYFVDGKTVQGDVYFDDQWHTILVGGLNKGGRAYYALDITDPDDPTVLWEFTHNNLGLSYSDPIITKHNGTWVVAFGSGYSNVSPGDGKGRLFMVNAQTGAIVKSLATTASGNGMAKVNVWVKSLSDNTAQRFYGGDVLGNVWRFKPDNTAATDGGTVVLLAQMKDAAGNGQPITTELKLREYYQKPIVVVTTGRYLDTDDINDTQVQSIAAIRDPDDDTGWGDIRNGTNKGKFKVVTLNKSGTAASGAAVDLDWSTDGGWRADFPTEGERVNIPAEWDGTTLLVATAVPEGDQCKSGGSSWLYRFGLAGGQANGKQYSDETLIVGFAVVRNDEGDPKILVRESAGKTEVEDGSGLGGGAALKRARRVSWRELIHDRPETN